MSGLSHSFIQLSAMTGGYQPALSHIWWQRWDIVSCDGFCPSPVLLWMTTCSGKSYKQPKMEEIQNTCRQRGVYRSCGGTAEKRSRVRDGQNQDGGGKAEMRAGVGDTWNPL